MQFMFSGVDMTSYHTLIALLIKGNSHPEMNKQKYQ